MTGGKRFFLRQCAWFAATCTLFMSMMLAVRNHAFCVYKAAETLSPVCRQGQRYLVNKLATWQPRRSDRVVYRNSEGQFLGMVEACPGDVVAVAGDSVELPESCPQHKCPGTGLYMLSNRVLVCRKDIVGIAYPLSSGRRHSE